MSEQPLPTVRRMTIEEYLAFEDAAETKHEYDDGVIVDMSDGSEESSSIENNLAGELRTRLRGLKMSSTRHESDGAYQAVCTVSLS